MFFIIKSDSRFFYQIAFLIPLISADLANFKNTSLDTFKILVNLFLRLVIIHRFVIIVLELVFGKLFNLKKAFHLVK
jgi:hypothetical protein